MFINGAVYQRLLDDLQMLTETVAEERHRHEILSEQSAAELATVRQELGTERGRREILSQQAAVQKQFVDFLCSRVNQLEIERVMLLRQLTNIDLPAPSLRPTTAAAPPPVDPAAILSDLSIFDDDPRHAPAGWHHDGSVNYGAPEPPTGGMTS
jgi:hypothetical protein